MDHRQSGLHNSVAQSDQHSQHFHQRRTALSTGQLKFNHSILQFHAIKEHTHMQPQDSSERTDNLWTNASIKAREMCKEEKETQIPKIKISDKWLTSFLLEGHRDGTAECHYPHCISQSNHHISNPKEQAIRNVVFNMKKFSMFLTGKRLLKRPNSLHFPPAPTNSLRALVPSPSPCIRLTSLSWRWRKEVPLKRQ